MTGRLSPDPPILTLPPPSQAVWVNGEPRNGEEILLVTPPSYTPTIGGLLTDPSTIPNPRLCCPPSNQGIQAYVGSRCHTSHQPAPKQGIFTHLNESSSGRFNISMETHFPSSQCRMPEVKRFDIKFSRTLQYRTDPHYFQSIIHIPCFYSITYSERFHCNLWSS